METLKEGVLYPELVKGFDSIDSTIQSYPTI